MYFLINLSASLKSNFCRYVSIFLYACRTCVNSHTFHYNRRSRKHLDQHHNGKRPCRYTIKTQIEPNSVSVKFVERTNKEGLLSYTLDKETLIN